MPLDLLILLDDAAQRAAQRVLLVAVEGKRDLCLVDANPVSPSLLGRELEAERVAEAAQLGLESIAKVGLVDGYAQPLELLGVEVLALPLAELVALGRATDDESKGVVIASAHSGERGCVLIAALHCYSFVRC